MDNPQTGGAGTDKKQTAHFPFFVWCYDRYLLHHWGTFYREQFRKNIQDGVKSLGNNTVYIDKWDYQGGAEYPWWKYVNRPSPKLIEMRLIKEKMSAKSMLFSVLPPNLSSNSTTTNWMESITTASQMSSIKSSLLKLHMADISIKWTLIMALPIL